MPGKFQMAQLVRLDPQRLAQHADRRLGLGPHRSATRLLPQRIVGELFAR
jgi:hypothetical protein